MIEDKNLTGKADGTHVFNCRRCPVSVVSRWLEPTCPECGDPTELDATAKPQRIELCELHGSQYVRGCAYCTGDLDTLEATQPAAPGAGEDSRFFIDHGIVHDRKTGKHLRGTDEYGDKAADLLAVLQELEGRSLLKITRGALRQQIANDVSDEPEASSPLLATNAAAPGMVELPELPSPRAFHHNMTHNPLYTSEQMRAYAKAALAAQPVAAGGMGDAEIRRVIHELRTYDPIADEYKGAHIHGVWARELEAALAAQPAPVDEPDKDYDSEGSGYYQCLIDVEKGIQELALSMGWDTDSSAYEVSRYIESFPVPEKYWKGAHLRYKVETEAPAQPAPVVGDSSMAMHWIDRYAAGIDDECQLDRVAEALLTTRPAGSVAQGGEGADHQWFGPDPHGNWYVRTGAKWWYATPKTMLTPEEFGCLNEDPKPETTPTESPVNEERTECAPQAQGEIGTDGWNAQQEAQIAAYANHPALKVPCKHCGTVGMCPYPLACVSAAANELTTPTPATGSGGDLLAARPGGEARRKKWYDEGTPVDESQVANQAAAHPAQAGGEVDPEMEPWAIDDTRATCGKGDRP